MAADKRGEADTKEKRYPENWREKREERKREEKENNRTAWVALTAEYMIVRILAKR